MLCRTFRKRGEPRMRASQPLVGVHAGAVGGAERRGETRRRLLAILAPGDDLAEQRVVAVRNRIAGGEAGIHAHRFHPRPLQKLQLPGARQESPLGIFGADARLDGVTVEAHLLLRQRQGLPGRDPQLPLDQVQPRDRLGDGVLHLQPRIHFHEIELVPVEEKFDGAGAHVAHLARDHEGGGAQPLAQRFRQRRRRRLFDQLLVAALDGAVAVAQVHEVAVRVGEHLHLDVARCRQVAFQKQRAIAERALGEAARGGERRGELATPRARSACPCRRRRRPA